MVTVGPILCKVVPSPKSHMNCFNALSEVFENSTSNGDLKILAGLRRNQHPSHLEFPDLK